MQWPAEHGEISARKLTKNGKRYYCEYTGPDGKRHTPGHSFASRTDAAGWLSAEKRLIDLQARKPPAARRDEKKRAYVTVGKWLDQYHDMLEQRAQSLKPSTAQNYGRVTRVRLADSIATGEVG